jgi:ubiquinone/menaquinone biosynthesis C-methylase UbiE
MSSTGHEDTVRESFRKQVEQFSGPDSVYVSPEVAWLAPLDGDMVALEVACGAGHVAESVAPFVRQVVAIDLTRELLDLGAERVAASGIRNVLLQEANGEALPFVDDSFDLAFCRASLHHFAEPVRAIEEMVRVGRAGGRVVINDLVAPSPDVRDRFDELHRLLDPSHVRTFLPEELVAALPREARCAEHETIEIRLPLEVSISEVSDRDAVVDALHEELDGGPASGFSPAIENDALVVTFQVCTVHGVVTA